jgi:hypothetical protein
MIRRIASIAASLARIASVAASLALIVIGVIVYVRAPMLSPLAWGVRQFDPPLLVWGLAAGPTFVLIGLIVLWASIFRWEKLSRPDETRRSRRHR